MAQFDWGLYSTMMSWTQKKLNNKGQKLSSEEIEKRLSEVFPKAYVYFYSLMMLLFIAVIVGGLFLGLFGFVRLQGALYHTSNIWLFITTGLSYGIFATVSLIFAFFISTLTLTIAPHYFPRFERFCAMMSLKQGWRSAWSFREQIFFLLKPLLIFSIISAPFLFFSLNNYSYVTQGGVCLNKFFTFHEQCYSWKEVSKVSVVSSIDSGRRGADHLDLGYVLYFNDGETTDLWPARDFLNQIIRIEQTLVSYNVPFEVEPVDDEVLRKLDRLFPPEDLETIRKILRIGRIY